MPCDGGNCVSNNETMHIKFWGVRGSIPVPGPRTVEYGGNTSCIQITMGKRQVVLDAGSGLVGLGEALAEVPCEVDLFLSHLHWDHILGFPFFRPVFQKSNRLRIYGPSLEPNSSFNPLSAAIAPPWFPVSMESMQADITYSVIDGEQTLNLRDGIIVRTMFTNHPGSCLAFRVEYKGCSCCYVSDHEHKENVHEQLVAFAQGSDVLIHDAQYTDQEYYGNGTHKPKIDWGHSTWQSVVKVAREAKVKRLFLFHHDPSRTDDALSAIEVLAKQKFPSCQAAKEGVVIQVCQNRS